MRREDFEHVIAAAANVTGEDEFVVIGSQAILGSHPVAPESMLRSMEADIYPLHRPDQADAIDGSLGDGSQFQRTFGYYAHRVGPETAKAPRGWRQRLVRVEILSRVKSDRSPIAWCLEPHDLVLAKCVAGRDRDWQFARDALAAGLVQRKTLLARVSDLPVSPRLAPTSNSRCAACWWTTARADCAALHAPQTPEFVSGSGRGCSAGCAGRR